MAVYLPGPRTFTGEDTAEVMTHGSRAVVEAMKTRLTRFDGVRHAVAGEFTKRAFLNGKLDTAAVNALGALINSRTERQLRQANRALAEGDWLAEALTTLRGRVSLVVDFGEHVDYEMEWVRGEMERRVEEIRRLRRSSLAANRVRRELRVVLLGRPNAGKSSIFNSFVLRCLQPVMTRRTTRDSLETRIEVEGVHVTIIDTAGIRDTTDQVEAEGVRRSIARASECDIAIGVVDSRNAKEEEAELRRHLPEGIEFILVKNKSDLADPSLLFDSATLNGVRTVATEEGGIRELEKELEKVVTLLCPQDAELDFTEGIDKVGSKGSLF